MNALFLAAVLLAQPAQAEASPTPIPAVELELPPAPAEDPRFSLPVTEDLMEPASSGTGFLVGSRVPHPSGRPSNADAFKMISVPAGCMAIGGAAWSGMSMHTGDAGTPALEMGAGYAGSWVGAIAAVGTMYVVDRDSFTPDPTKRMGGLAAPMTVSALAIPVGAGLGTFLAGEELEGRSKNPEEALAASIAGAALGELLVSFAAFKLDTPGAQGPMIVAFVPVGVGSTLGYRIARGGGKREKPLMRAPVMMVVRF